MCLLFFKYVFYSTCEVIPGMSVFCLSYRHHGC